MLAQRRMFSIKITSSAKFLKMPLEVQALYFHLVQNADDDGVVEGFSIMRLIGSSEDALKLLVYKNYIEILNDDLVIFVVDWLEHNKIRADRKVDSIYKNLLIEKIPQIQLVEAKTRTDRNKNCVNGTSQGRPLDRQGTEEVRLGQGSIVKGSLVDDSLSESRKDKKSINDNNIFKFYRKNFDEDLKPFIADDINNFIEIGVEEDLILELMKCAVVNGAKKWNYVSKAIMNNLNSNIKTLDEYKEHESEREQSKKFKDNQRNLNNNPKQTSQEELVFKNCSSHFPEEEWSK